MSRVRRGPNNLPVDGPAFGPRHSWILTAPSREGLEAWRCADCSLIVQHGWGPRLHKASLLLTVHETRMREIPACVP